MTTYKGFNVPAGTDPANVPLAFRSFADTAGQYYASTAAADTAGVPDNYVVNIAGVPMYRYSSVWRPVGVAVCTSGTRPTASEGATIYETDTDKLLTYTTSATGWVRPWNMPWGVVAYNATATTTQTYQSGVGTGGNIVHSTAFTAKPKRVYRVHGTTGVGASVRTIFDPTNGSFGARFGIRLYVNGSAISESKVVSPAVDYTNNFFLEHLIVNSGTTDASYTVDFRSFAEGVMTARIVGFSGSFLAIEDIGPVTGATAP